MQDKETEAQRFSDLAKFTQLITIRARIQSRHSDSRRKFGHHVILAPNMPEPMFHSCQGSGLCHVMILLAIVQVFPLIQAVSVGSIGFLHVCLKQAHLEGLKGPDHFQVLKPLTIIPK